MCPDEEADALLGLLEAGSGSPSEAAAKGQASPELIPSPAADKDILTNTLSISQLQQAKSPLNREDLPGLKSATPLGPEETKFARQKQ